MVRMTMTLLMGTMHDASEVMIFLKDSNLPAHARFRNQRVSQDAVLIRYNQSAPESLKQKVKGGVFLRILSDRSNTVRFAYQKVG